MVIGCHLVSSGHPKALPGFINFSTQASNPAHLMNHRPHLALVDASRWAPSTCTPCDHLRLDKASKQIIVHSPNAPQDPTGFLGSQGTLLAQG